MKNTIEPVYKFKTMMKNKLIVNCATPQQPFETAKVLSIFSIQ